MMRRLVLIATLLFSAPPAFAESRVPPAGHSMPISTMRPAPAGYGVIFATRAPGSGYGMVVAETDRLAALRIAELRCSRGGPGCRVIAEFSATCGAVAQGLRRTTHGLAFTEISGGSAPDRQSAEADALAECRFRDPRANCQVVATQCGNRDG